MLDALITSKTRIKLLLKFFLNSNSKSYLRHLESEFGGSSNGIRLELNRFEKAGLLTSTTTGNKKFFQANSSHPLFPDINNIVMKYVGLDIILENVINKLGDLEKVFLCGEFAKGLDCKIIDLIFVGKKIDRNYLFKLVEKVEKLIKRRVRYIVYSGSEFKSSREGGNGEEVFVLWEGGEEVLSVEC